MPLFCLGPRLLLEVEVLINFRLVTCMKTRMLLNEKVFGTSIKWYER